MVAVDPKTKHADCIVTDGRQTEDSEPSTTSKIAARWQKNDANMKNEHSVMHEEELEHLHYVAKVNECNELMDYQIYQARLKDHEEELDRFEWARQRRADDEAMAREEQAVRRRSHTERMEQYERADKRLQSEEEMARQTHAAKVPEHDKAMDHSISTIPREEAKAHREDVNLPHNDRVRRVRFDET